MDGLQAAILNAKLQHLPAWTRARQRVAATYDELFRETNMVITPRVAPDREHVYHLYVIRTENRDGLKKHLDDAGISTVINYPKALPLYPAYAYLRHKADDFPIAHANQSRILSLPIYPEMTPQMIEYVVHLTVNFAQRKSEVMPVAI
jgi:dTDP-4-amino-4,6-dideoxygalactose transaminase